MAHSQTFANLIQSLAPTNNFLLVTSAGNGNGDGGVSAFTQGIISSIFDPHSPQYTKHASIRSRVLIVGATEGKGQLASYSNYGSAVEIVAPGGGGLCGAFIDPFQMGPYLFQQNIEWNPADWVFPSEYNTQNEAIADCKSKSHRGVLSYGIDSKKIYISGTSQAAPHVAGVVATIYSINPTLTAAEVKTILLNNSKRVTDSRGQTYASLDMNAAVSATPSPTTTNHRDDTPPSLTVITRVRCKVGDTYTDIANAPLEIYLINNIDNNIGGPQLETDAYGIHSATILQSTLKSSGADTLVVYIPRSPANKIPSNPPINRGFTLDNLDTGPSVRTIDIVVRSKSLAECGTASSSDISISTTSVDPSDRPVSPIGEAFVTSVAPTTVSIGAPVAFTVSGQNLPLTAVMAIQDATCHAPTNNTATGFTQVCTLGGTVSTKVVTVKTNTAANGGIAIDSTRTITVSAEGSASEIEWREVCAPTCGAWTKSNTILNGWYSLQGFTTPGQWQELRLPLGSSYRLADLEFEIVIKQIGPNTGIGIGFSGTSPGQSSPSDMTTSYLGIVTDITNQIGQVWHVKFNQTGATCTVDGTAHYCYNGFTNNSSEVAANKDQMVKWLSIEENDPKGIKKITVWDKGIQILSKEYFNIN